MGTQGIAPAIQARKLSGSKKIFIKAAGFGTGVILACSLIVWAFFWYQDLPKQSTSWQTITFDGTSYRSEAIFSDLGVPDLKATGRVKFVPVSEHGNTYQLGYQIQIDMKPLDMSKVPTKYKQERKAVENGFAYTIDPIESATYQAQFEFTLADRDGFTIATIFGNKDYVRSGQKEMHQNLVTESVSPEMLRRTKKISGHVTILTCETCFK